MTDENHHTHTLPDGEVVHSHEDGSCTYCRQEAEASGKCGSCYGIGSFTTDDCTFDCMKCCGTGDQLTPAQAADFKAKGWKSRTLYFNDDSDGA